jgi:arabinose-5-phosphate isomerase
MLREIFTSQRHLLNHFFENVQIDEAEKVLREFLGCRGSLIFSGIGKSGIIADKLAKTMVSTGTRAMYLPPSNAIHGDIGMLQENDLVILLSKSGKSPEILEFAEIIRRRRIRSMAWVSLKDSPVASLVDEIVHLPLARELCPFDLAPTTSAAVQMIFGDIIAVALMKAKNFSLDQYALNHPGGAIGKLISERVKDIMVTGKDLPLCKKEDLLRNVLVELSKKRLGCLLIVDEKMRLEGIFTDGDLRRALQEIQKKVLDLPMSRLMTKSFLCTSPGMLASAALEKMEGEKKIMMLPVIEDEVLVGLIHMHHILSPTPVKKVFIT